MINKFHEYGPEFPLTVQGIYNSHIEVPNYQSIFHSRYNTNYKWLQKPTGASVGDFFKPFDNSYCIDLETGNDAYLAHGYCCDYEVGASFKIVEEPYWSLVSVLGIFTPYLFVNVISTKTGRYYRVLFG